MAINAGFSRVLVVTGFFILTAVCSFGQQKPPEPSGDVVFEKAIQPPDVPLPPPGDTFFYVASEMSFDGKLVKGAPYSAQATTETTQTLSDGNRIVNKFSSAVYRDAEGRTRREQVLKNIGPFANGGEPMQAVFISDPVAGVSYSLDSRSHTAHKSAPFRVELPPNAGTSFSGSPAGPTAHAYVFKTKPADAAAEGPQAEIGVTTIRTAGPGGEIQLGFKREVSGALNISKESLGKQDIEGVTAEGTRTTVTIPAGQIGNERPIQIVDERWYSSQLQVMVMTRHSDPRVGETVYRLTSISRDEPDHSLFEVPAGYTIKDEPFEKGFRVRKPGTDQ